MMCACGMCCSYDSRWDGVKIVVLEQICVSPPYSKDEIKPLDKAVKQDFLERIATMVRHTLCFHLLDSVD